MVTVDLTGRTFGILTILGRVEGCGYRWVAQCSCGRKTVALTTHLKSGHAKSCGCKKGRWTHGKTGTPEYRTWQAMIYRCTNRKSAAWKNYGGRSITVCKRWLASFDNFLADMGPRPGLKYEIDRYPNNAGNYEPGNCRWVTRKVNARNKRTNRVLTFKDTTHTMAEWAEITGLSRGSIWDRLNRGYSIEEALTTPQHVHHKRRS
jgi:predicted DNA-binding transcriptional regulator AlpA